MDSLTRRRTKADLPGWYYQRQVTQVAVAASSAAGTSAAGSFAQFTNETPGLGSRGLPRSGSRWSSFPAVESQCKDQVRARRAGPQKRIWCLPWRSASMTRNGSRWGNNGWGLGRAHNAIGKRFRSYCEFPNRPAKRYLRVRLRPRRAVRRRNPDRPHTSDSSRPHFCPIGGHFWKGCRSRTCFYPFLPLDPFRKFSPIRLNCVFR